MMIYLGNDISLDLVFVILISSFVSVLFLFWFMEFCNLKRSPI